MTVTPRGKRLIALIATVAIAGLGVFGWQWLHRPRASVSVTTPPGIPESVLDHEVRSALTTAREKILAEPQSSEAWGQLGFIFRSHLLLPQSTACFAEAAKLESANPRWQYLIGTTDLRFSPGVAIPHLRNAMALARVPEEQSAARLQLAEALLDRNELEEAAALFRDELTTDLRNPRAHYGLGVIAVNRGDAATAVNHLIHAVNSPHSRQKASALLASSYYQLGKTAEAEGCERAALHLPEDPPWPDPFDPGVFAWQTGLFVHRTAALKLESQGRFDESLASLQEIAQQYPDEPVAVRKGIALVNKRDYMGAENALREALAKDPNTVIGHCYLGIALYGQAEMKWQRGDRAPAKELFQRALVELRKAIALKPDLGLAHVHLAYSLKSLDKLPEALEASRAAISARPHVSISHVCMAEVLIAMGKTQEAIPHLETAVKLAQPGDNRAKNLLEKLRKS